jgi:hypothetical protein
MKYTRPQILTTKQASRAIQSAALKHDDTIDNSMAGTKTTPAAYEADE